MPEMCLKVIISHGHYILYVYNVITHLYYSSNVIFKVDIKL